MPRAARLDIPDLLQHVIVRGVNRAEIFLDDSDRIRFLERFSELLLETGTECLAWSLMTNHLHLLLRPRKSRLAPFMRRLLTGYALYFNRRHQRSGHLFQNRYKSLVCEEDKYLLELVRYIHLNPLRAGLVESMRRLDSYRWCGHAVLLGRGVLNGQVTGEVLRLFSEEAGEGRRRYRKFVADGIALGRREDLAGGTRLTRGEAADDELRDDRVLGSGLFIQDLQRQRDLALKIPRSMSVGEVIGRVCNHFDTDPEKIRQRSKAARMAEIRSIICYFAVRQIGHNGVEVGRQIGIGRSAVSLAASRGETIIKTSPELLLLLDN